MATKRYWKFKPLQQRSDSPHKRESGVANVDIFFENKLYFQIISTKHIYSSKLIPSIWMKAPSERGCIWGGKHMVVPNSLKENNNAIPTAKLCKMYHFIIDIFICITLVYLRILNQRVWSLRLDCRKVIFCIFPLLLFPSGSIEQSSFPGSSSWVSTL